MKHVLQQRTAVWMVFWVTQPNTTVGALEVHRLFCNLTFCICRPNALDNHLGVRLMTVTTSIRDDLQTDPSNGTKSRQTGLLLSTAFSVQCLLDLMWQFNTLAPAIIQTQICLHLIHLICSKKNTGTKFRRRHLMYYRKERFWKTQISLKPKSSLKS